MHVCMLSIQTVATSMLVVQISTASMLSIQIAATSTVTVSFRGRGCGMWQAEAIKRGG